MAWLVFLLAYILRQCYNRWFNQVIKTRFTFLPTQRGIKPQRRDSERRKSEQPPSHFSPSLCPSIVKNDVRIKNTSLWPPTGIKELTLNLLITPSARNQPSAIIMILSLFPTVTDYTIMPARESGTRNNCLRALRRVEDWARLTAKSRHSHVPRVGDFKVHASVTDVPTRPMRLVSAPSLGEHLFWYCNKFLAHLPGMRRASFGIS